MSEEELININGIKEDLYQAMQIGNITLNCKNSQELYDFMNYQDKEIESLHSIIKEVREKLCKYGLVDKEGNFNAYLDTIELKELLEILDKENK